MTPDIVPIGETRRRLPQSGRIRLGVKGGRQGRKAIDTFRFTSPTREHLDQIARVYGGVVKPFNETKSGDRFEVITTTREVRVILPPDALSEWYEEWNGKVGLQRRCDGQECDILTTTPDGPEVQRVPCRCRREGVLSCDYKLRLNVLLPEVDSIGTWRLDTGSEHARKEIPGVVDLIEMAQGRGLYRATLRLEQRTAPGRRFYVPVLDLGVSVEALLAGGARLSSLPVTAPTPELAAGDPGDLPPSPGSPPTDEEVIDAEVVDDDPPLVFDPATGIHPVNPAINQAFLESLNQRQRNAALLRARDLAMELGEEVPVDLDSASPLIVDALVREHNESE